MSNAFDERRLLDPSGLIDDLVQQTSAQAKRIHDMRGDMECSLEAVELSIVELTKAKEALTNALAI